jgi:hypothetical protein
MARKKEPELTFPEGPEMSRFVFRFKGREAMPAPDLARIESETNLTVVDRSSRMLLVEAEEQTVHRLAEALSEWTVSPERTIPLPDTRRKTHSSRIEE